MTGKNSGQRKKHLCITPAIFILLFSFFSVLSLPAQDFWFGFDDKDGEGASGGTGGSAFPVSIGGEIAASLTGFVNDFSDGAEQTRLGDVFRGKLNFTAESSNAKGVINLKLASGLIYYKGQSPIYVDEAYVSACFGIFDIEGGLRKLTWGKADSMGPLDVINPADMSDLTDSSDTMNLKTARPLVHTSLISGQFSKLEAVFVPNFEAAGFAETGPWAPAQSQLPTAKIIPPDTTTLNYAQTGLRYTTTIGSAADIGIQYYYGRLTTPAVTKSGTPSSPIVTFAYNPYHQIGVDWAQVIADFNLRAEFAANITEDINGDDGGVYNPSLAWSFGFDRDLFADTNLNLQCNETIRLLDSEISNPQDIEAGDDLTSTRITAALSRKFLRDELELKAACLWEVESGTCVVMPSLIWTKNDATVDLAAGIFAGSDEGQFGQFHDKSFVKAGMKYTF
jgi:hypothetical protein